jgi:DNA-binding transcriptional ArsR family regulator
VLPMIKDRSLGLLLGPRMAAALADPWRARVLMELADRSLSPSQFVEQIGGDLDHVSRCFRQLADYGYVEVVEERPGRRQGASIEHIYGAVERAYFDTATWEGLPRFQRDLISDSILGSFFRRVSEAVDAGTFDRETDRHLSWDGVVLDRVAWTQLGAELDEILIWLSELERSSVKRLSSTHGEVIPTTVSLSAFRSPQSAQVVWGAPRRESGENTSGGGSGGDLITMEMAKAMKNRWRSRIMMELNARPLSPSRFVEEVGGSPSYISRCFKQLAEWGYINVVEERPGGRYGGGVERIYRNAKRAYFSTDNWAKLPYVFRTEFSASILGSYLARITESIKAGAFDAEKDRHLSWMPVSLDRTAWSSVSPRLDQILDSLPKREEESLARTNGRVEELIPTTVGLISFRSPS